ncbi:hypothetical protein [Muricoccus radiodurans]|uniref:hypothetical protein n=1 Tax=Muricoccus radiodurans TaxID=2231721 RepID=UPI003CEAA6DB
MILQLDPPLPMDTVRGPGLAHFMIDYGPESHLMWVVFMDADGACWTVPNPEVRMQSNWTLQRRPKGRPFQAPPAPQPAAPIRAPAGADPALAALNGNGGPNGHPAGLNGHGVNGTPRYDAAPG